MTYTNKECQKSVLKGCVNIFIDKHLQFTTVNLDTYCTKQDTDVCALKLNSTYKHICILTLYRAPFGRFNNFLTQLENV